MRRIKEFFFPKPSLAYEDEILPLIDSDDILGIDQLVEAKSIDLTLPTKQGISLLSYAAYKNKTNVIRYLHSKGCDVNLLGRNGENPLIRACYYKRYESIDVLLELGANINKKFDDYPIIHALYRGNPELIRYILKKGADLSILHQNEYSELRKNLSPEISLIIKQHEAFKSRLSLLFLLKYGNSSLNRLSTWKLRELAFFIY